MNSSIGKLNENLHPFLRSIDLRNLGVFNLRFSEATAGRGLNIINNFLWEATNSGLSVSVYNQRICLSDGIEKTEIKIRETQAYRLYRPTPAENREQQRKEKKWIAEHGSNHPMPDFFRVYPLRKLANTGILLLELSHVEDGIRKKWEDDKRGKLERKVKEIVQCAILALKKCAKRHDHSRRLSERFERMRFHLAKKDWLADREQKRLKALLALSQHIDGVSKLPALLDVLKASGSNSPIVKSMEEWLSLYVEKNCSVMTKIDSFKDFDLQKLFDDTVADKLTVRDLEGGPFWPPCEDW